MQILRSLRHRPFALLWTGQSVSRLGDSFYRIALAWWVLEKTGSATAMGTVLTLAFAPMLLFLLVGGVAVDRFRRPAVMLVCDLSSAAIVGTVAVLAASGVLAVWHVYLASVLFGLVEAFFYPAYTAAVPELTPAELLPSANSLTSLSTQVSGIAGPAAAAFVVGLGGTPLAFALDALTFVLSAVFLIPLARHAAPPGAPAGGGRAALADLRDGLGLVLASPWLSLTIALFALVNVTASGPRAVALPFLVERDLGAGVHALGWIQSAGAAGSVAAAVWLGRRMRLRRRGPAAYLATIAAGLSLALLGLRLGLAAALAGSLLNGAAFAVFGLIWTNTLQELVPREKLGRVSSIDALGSFVLLPVGFAAAGWATDALGPSAVFLAGGLLTAALAALGLLHPAIRRLD